MVYKGGMVNAGHATFCSFVLLLYRLGLSYKYLGNLSKMHFEIYLN